MKKIIVDGKEKKIPYDTTVEIKAKESVEAIVEEKGYISKSKLTIDGLTIEIQKKNSNISL